jgi:hypothetical protein
MEEDFARQIVQEMEKTSDTYRIVIAHLRSQIIQWKNIAGGLAECLVEQMDDPESDNAEHIKQIHNYARALQYDGGELDSAIHLGEFLNKMEL